jgi:hypothetical protein
MWCSAISIADLRPQLLHPGTPESGGSPPMSWRRVVVALCAQVRTPLLPSPPPP